MAPSTRSNWYPQIQKGKIGLDCACDGQTSITLPTGAEEGEVAGRRYEEVNLGSSCVFKSSTAPPIRIGMKAKSSDTTPGLVYQLQCAPHWFDDLMLHTGEASVDCRTRHAQFICPFIRPQYTCRLWQYGSISTRLLACCTVMFAVAETSASTALVV
jgi:hypothetical protein